MTHNDSILGRLDVSLLMDDRWRKLSATGTTAFLTLYLTAVEHRLSLLPTQYDRDALSGRTGLDRRTYKKALQTCKEVGLIKLTHDKTI